MTVTTYWSNEQLHNLELAEDLMDTVSAIASREIYKEGGGDKDTIAYWRNLQAEVKKDRRSLKLQQVEAMDAAIQRYTALSRQLLRTLR